MINICNQCKVYRADKEIDLEKSVAICPECGYGNPFDFHPLFVVLGPSAAGKSTTCRRLMTTMRDVIILEGDIIWQKELNSPENGYRVYFETWLRLAKNIAQAGRPVALFMSGGLPQNVDPCIESRYFSKIHYLSLVCDDETLRERLRARPEWRGGYPDEMLLDQTNFNQWLKDHADERGITLLDTTTVSVEETSDQLTAWFESHLAAK